MIQKSKKAKLELKERRNVTSRYHGSKISGIRSNDDGDGDENGKKAKGFLRACLHGGGGPQVGEVTRLGGVTRLSI